MFDFATHTIEYFLIILSIEHNKKFQITNTYRLEMIKKSEFALVLVS